MEHKAAVFSLLAIIMSACSVERDAAAGREILRLKPGAYIVTPKDGGPELEIGISKDGYSVTELTEKAVPPFTILKNGDKIEYSFTTIEDRNEIVLMDKNGDGIPDQRLIVFRDKDGKSTRSTVETVEVTFKPKKHEN